MAKYLSEQLEEACEMAGDQGIVVYMDFYENALQMSIERESARFPKVDVTLFGGHDDAQRKMLSVHPKDHNVDPASFPLKTIQFSTQKTDITHQDVLGALMGLGIVREKVGDIDFIDDTCQIFVSDSLADFVVTNLAKVSAYGVNPKIVDLSKVLSAPPTFTEVDLVIASLRIDNIIHGAYRLSRTEAAQFVKNERVSINHVVISKPSVNVKEGDIVSVRSKGRLKVDSVNGTTKKGNLKVRILKYG
jgi:RNA-binding protein YlmH